jgi:hypothetical protein
MGLGNLFKVRRDGDRALQLLFLNEEFLVIAGHQPAMITSLPFVHTARRSYRWLNRWGLGMNLGFRQPQGWRTWKQNLFKSF